MPCARRVRALRRADDVAWLPGGASLQCLSRHALLQPLPALSCCFLSQQSVRIAPDAVAMAFANAISAAVKTRAKNGFHARVIAFAHPGNFLPCPRQADNHVLISSSPRLPAGIRRSAVAGHYTAPPRLSCRAIKLLSRRRLANRGVTNRDVRHDGGKANRRVL